MTFPFPGAAVPPASLFPVAYGGGTPSEAHFTPDHALVVVNGDGASPPAVLRFHHLEPPSSLALSASGWVAVAFGARVEVSSPQCPGGRWCRTGGFATATRVVSLAWTDRGDGLLCSTAGGAVSLHYLASRGPPEDRAEWEVLWASDEAATGHPHAALAAGEDVHAAAASCVGPYAAAAAPCDASPARAAAYSRSVLVWPTPHPPPAGEDGAKACPQRLVHPAPVLGLQWRPPPPRSLRSDDPADSAYSSGGADAESPSALLTWSADGVVRCWADLAAHAHGAATRVLLHASRPIGSIPAEGNAQFGLVVVLPFPSAGPWRGAHPATSGEGGVVPARLVSARWASHGGHEVAGCRQDGASGVGAKAPGPASRPFPVGGACCCYVAAIDASSGALAVWALFGLGDCFPLRAPQAICVVSQGGLLFGSLLPLPTPCTGRDREEGEGGTSCKHPPGASPECLVCGIASTWQCSAEAGMGPKRVLRLWAIGPPGCLRSLACPILLVAAPGVPPSSPPPSPSSPSSTTAWRRRWLRHLDTAMSSRPSSLRRRQRPPPSPSWLPWARQARRGCGRCPLSRRGGGGSACLARGPPSAGFLPGPEASSGLSLRSIRPRLHRWGREVCERPVWPPFRLLGRALALLRFLQSRPWCLAVAGRPARSCL